MKTENLGIPALRTQTKFCTSDVDKAQALNEQFQSVFNPRPTHEIPVKPNSPFQGFHISYINISFQGQAHYLSVWVNIFQLSKE